MKIFTKHTFAIAALVISSFAAQAQVKVGNNPTTINPSAVLEVESTNKGFLPPRVDLTSQTLDLDGVAGQATGLMIYNIGTTFVPGFYYWNGTEWRNLSNSTSTPPAITAINCATVKLEPATYTAGVPYTGVMSVSYSGGNGSSYGVGSPINSTDVTGLTATLQAGTLSAGSGMFSYNVSGTPSASSPNKATFALPTIFGATGCNALVGEGTFIAQGDLLYYKASMPAAPVGWLSAYSLDLPVIDGKLRLDSYFNASSNAGNGSITMRPRLVNVSGSPVKLWFSATTTVNNYNAGNYLLAPSTPTGSGTSLAPSAYVELDDYIYYGFGYDDKLGISTPRVTGDGQGGHQEVVTVDIALDGKWYRVYYFPIVDNKDTAITTDNTREIYLSIQRLY